METNIDNKKNEDFLEILQNKEGLISKVDQKVLFITPDSWLAHQGAINQVAQTIQPLAPPACASHQKIHGMAVTVPPDQTPIPPEY